MRKFALWSLVSVGAFGCAADVPSIPEVVFVEQGVLLHSGATPSAVGVPWIFVPGGPVSSAPQPTPESSEVWGWPIGLAPMRVLEASGGHYLVEPVFAPGAAGEEAHPCGFVGEAEPRWRLWLRSEDAMQLAPAWSPSTVIQDTISITSECTDAIAKATGAKLGTSIVVTGHDREASRQRAADLEAKIAEQRAARRVFSPQHSAEVKAIIGNPRRTRRWVNASSPLSWPDGGAAGTSADADQMMGAYGARRLGDRWCLTVKIGRIYTSQIEVCVDEENTHAVD